MFNTMLDVLRYRAYDSPNKVALYDIDYQRAYTYKQLEARADAAAAFLVERLGLKPGDRVAVISGNSLYVIDLFFASCETGVIIDVVNPRLHQDEIAQMLEAEEPAAVFFSSKFGDKVLSVAESLSWSCIPVCFDGGCPVVDLSGADMESYVSDGTFAPIYPDSEDIQMLLHTGGTTGFPKAAMLSYRYFVMNSVAEMVSWRLTDADGVYAAMPLFHTSGWCVSMMPAFLAGSRVSLSREFSPDVFLDLVEARHLSVFMGADLLLSRVAASPRFEGTDFSRMRLLCCGASTVSQGTLDAFWAKGLRLFMGYGMTEYGPNGISSSVDQPMSENLRKPWIIGKPLVFNRVRIVREDGADAAVGEVGEVYLNGPLAFSGYWNNPVATAEAFDDGWVKSGDMAFIDEDGDITLCGRRKNMYISGGENVFPGEVERVLEGHPAVAEACVIGVPDGTWGEVGKAVLVLEPGADAAPDEIRAWLKSRLSTIKRPHYYAFAEGIPTNTAGKRDLASVRKAYGQPADGLGLAEG